MQASAHKGFTIVEVMIYVALVSSAMVVLARFTTDVVQNSVRSQVIKEVELNAQLTLNRISSEIRYAQAITNVSATELTLVDVNNNQLILRYDALNNRVERVIGGNAESLTAPGIRVTGLNFKAIQVAGVNKGAAINLTVAQGPISPPLMYQHSSSLATSVFARQLIY
jgi:Tfp pilus assembly protein PilE